MKNYDRFLCRIHSKCHPSRGVENPRALRTVKCYVIEARRSPNERFRSTPYPIDASVFMYWYRWYEHRFRLFTSSLIQFLEYYLIYTQLSATPPIVKTNKARQIRWWQSNCVWFREWINFILLNETSQYSIAVTFWHTLFDSRMFYMLRQSKFSMKEWEFMPFPAFKNSFLFKRRLPSFECFPALRSMLF